MTPAPESGALVGEVGALVFLLFKTIPASPRSLVSASRESRRTSGGWKPLLGLRALLFGRSLALELCRGGTASIKAA